MTDYCSFADPFYGCGETNIFPENGIASRWFYIKAQCGNTTPHAVLPFGKISAGAYSGGYPTGYGSLCPNFCGGAKKFSDKLKIRGFSHLHQSGTGAIGYYYNYAVVTPFYGKIDEIQKFREVKADEAKPGYYFLELEDIKAELTVTHDTAFHRYTFYNENGRIAVDFSNDGLLKDFGERYYSFAKDAFLETNKKDTVYFSGVLSGVKLCFCVKAQGENISTKLFTDCEETEETSLCEIDTEKPFGAVFDFDGGEAMIKVSYSTISFEEAEKSIDNFTSSFEETRQSAYRKWNTYLSKIEIETKDETLREKFYSNLYHSLIKPCILTGENVLGVKGETVTDLATMWDQYKTLFPLIYMVYGGEGEKIAKAIKNISETLGKISCSFALTDKFPCEQQAKMLGIITLCDAYFMGLCDKRTIDECIERELSRDDYKDFLETGFFERYTHILDVTDACLFVSEITENEELKKKLLTIAEKWKNAYGEDGLMSENSPYYEGDRYTYSFRLQANIEERIALSGGKENYTKLLDDFFGFGKPQIQPVTDTEDPGAKIKEKMCHRFEGFNNECDMETPFSYIFTGRHDRLCEIVTSAVKKSWNKGENGLPGNNDSGGLSSCFVWLTLGLFPWAGSGKMLLGCPQVDKAKIHLHSGKTLEIETVKESGSEKVSRIYFNGREIKDYTAGINEILGGGKLEFVF